MISALFIIQSFPKWFLHFWMTFCKNSIRISCEICFVNKHWPQSCLSPFKALNNSMNSLVPYISFLYSGWFWVQIGYIPRSGYQQLELFFSKRWTFAYFKIAIAGRNRSQRRNDLCMSTSISVITRSKKVMVKCLVLFLSLIKICVIVLMQNVRLLVY